MCFSASASFGAGAVLTVIGAVSIKKTSRPSQIPFASIPLLFALQQIAEGFLWLALSNPDFAFLNEFMTYAFLFFAQVLWPIWVPFSILKFEKPSKRKLFSKILVGLGFLIAALLGYMLIVYPVSSEVVSCHISYIQKYPMNLLVYGGTLYILTTIGPTFFVSSKRMWTLGVAIAISYVATEFFYSEYVVSVWCFFAAITSALVLWIVVGSGKEVN
ncbi:MAG: DUF6629 family protein [Brumimicrobium sp.]